MGILDDAIREHLDLKRRLGADDLELARLEDEAFGPPSRPGDPDFPQKAPEGAEQAAPTGEAVATETRPEPDGAEAQPARTEPETVADQAQTPAPEPRSGTEPAPSEPPPAEPPPSEPITGEAPAPTPGPTGAEPPATDAPSADAPESASQSGFYDQTSDQPAPAETAEPPIELQDTVEHPFEGAITETGESERIEDAEVVDEPATGAEPRTGEDAEVVDEPASGEEPLTGEQAEVVEGELEEDEDEEDVLEETPEFLRDAPEDDELWFEQGEPKDFDF